MLNDKIAEYVELLNSAIVTPFNLLENIKLDNYESINYFKEDEFIVADIIFLVNNDQIKYQYHFDMDNHLQKIFYVSETEKVLEFDREEEKTKLYQELKNKSRCRKCV